ncbi:hypothetical protein AB0M35_06915 [Micromonospora sp. NPDC051196]|uniref:hypothetical protein n=1 Tax=Micromonospora sp. NPDC051196 TaxID=3155281 RepID=UPI00341B973B
MTEAARKVAEEAELRFDNLAEHVQKRFDRITNGRFSDQVKSGRFSGQTSRPSNRPSSRNTGGNWGVRVGQGGHGAGQARTDQHRRERGGSR